MSSFNISFKGHDRVAKKLGFDVEKFLKSAVFEVAGTVETSRNKYIRQRIYAKSPSPNYKRTGRALGGSANTQKDTKGLKREVLSDTRIKGAEKNYAPMLNKNKKFKKFNTKFWDDAVKDGERKEQEVYKDFTKKIRKI